VLNRTDLSNATYEGIKDLLVNQSLEERAVPNNGIFVVVFNLIIQNYQIR
jgi:hypothetical protein